MENCYDNIDRHRLINVLKKNIDDQKFLDLIHKLFNANVICFRAKSLPRSILLSIFSNIYLHKLDVEIAKITEKYQKGKKRRVFQDVLNGVIGSC